MNDRFDLIVVGAGPAGCAAARAFALSGKSVALLEAEPEGQSHKRFAGEWLHPQGVDALEQIGFGSITSMKGR
ncbi:MAG: FAD-dependent oxidoreductase, partial [Verrucomicrobia bacterium]|nr:FAD-dependent oxidoreductase [Verrucomicrobiota bacterium]